MLFSDNSAKRSEGCNCQAVLGTMQVPKFSHPSPCIQSTYTAILQLTETDLTLIKVNLCMKLDVFSLLGKSH